MKTKSLLHGFQERFLDLVVLFILIVAAPGAWAASATELFEKAIYTEETKGELRAASDLYQQIVDDPNAERSLVAQAQLRRGLCELKLGNKPQAISALERLTQEFPDRDKLLAMIERHMPGLLGEMVKQIEQNYLLEIDRSELMETAIRAIIGKLDSRTGLLRANDTEFLSPQSIADMNISLEQKVGGVGVVLGTNEATGEVMVRSTLPDSPAQKGGLIAGDRIITVNGALLEQKIAPAIKLLRGPAGTPVTVGVKRDGLAEVLNVELVRETIRLPSVKGDRYKPDRTWEFMLDDQRKVGYVRLTYIGKETPEEMRAALEELRARGMRALILDLRNNPGGSLDHAVAVADLFVENGRIVTVKSRANETAHEAKPEGTFSGFPIALLVNGKTASAAEIVAACLQDHQRAVVVGERTFGQGIVRTVVQLQGGVGALKLPVAAYYRPSGKNVNRYPNSTEADDWGVRPDDGYEVKFTDEELKQYEQDLSARDPLHGPAAPKTQFNDIQLRAALDCVLAQLEN